MNKTAIVFSSAESVSKSRDVVSISGYSQSCVADIDAAIERRLLRKLDIRLIPLMFVVYVFNFADKSILSSASVFGLAEDTHLVGQQYSWLSSIFYFGYLSWAYPTSCLVTKLPVSKYIFLNTVFWGLIVALSATCHNFGGLAALRFLLGCAEATITPGFVYITAMYYTRDEIPSRTGAWFCGNSFGGFIASIVAYGIGHIEKPLTPWQWLFIIFGVATSFVGIAVYFVLPDSIEGAPFLSEEEKKCAQARVVSRGTGKASLETNEWKKDQTVECFLDPKTYFLIIISLCTQIPNSGTNSFANLVITGFGFSSLESTLVAIPSAFIAFFTILITGWISGKFKNISCFLIIFVVIWPVIGSALIYPNSTSNGVRLFGYYLIATGPGALPLAMSLMSSNYKGVTKKMTMTAIMFIIYCVGNIAGPQFFKSSEAPHYITAFKTIMICYAISAITAAGFWCYLRWENARRDEIEGFVRWEDRELTEEDYEDVTDMKTKGMRYRM